MSFLDEIRKQSRETREIMFGLSVFIAVMLVGMVWFRSFQKDIYVLMNPDQDVERMFAVDNAPAPSLFGFVWQTAGDIKGLVSGLINGNKEADNIDFEKAKKEESGKVYTLPLSEYK